MTVDVAVVGSANLDVVLHVPRMPAAGETILGSGYAEATGGKGANQALASARLVQTAFVGTVGTDAAGSRIRQGLVSAGVDVEFLASGSTPTGRAFIPVTPDAENSIVVLPMANSTVEAESVTRALTSLRPAVVLCQLEIPLAAVVAAALWAAANRARFILNPSPVADVPAEVLALADPLIVNAGEARDILRSDTRDLQELCTALTRVARSAVVTGGADGAWVASHDENSGVEGIRAVPVDTTGAGDIFAGTLAAELASGSSLAEAAGRANRLAAQAVELARSER